MALLALASASPAALAADDAPSVEFTVTVIHASNEGRSVDPALARFEKYFSRSFNRYSRFDQLKVERAAVPSGADKGFTLADGTRLTLTYEELRNGFVRVGLKLGSLTTTINVRDGGLFFQAGRAYDGGILVLAIEVRSAG